MKKLSEKYLTIYDVNEIVEKEIKEREKFSIYEQELTLKYCEEFAKIPKEKIYEMKKELKEKISRLSDDIIVKIADILPKTFEELQVILKSTTLVLSEDESKLIIEIVKKYTEGE